MKRYMAHILISAEKITEHFLKVQVHDEGTLADGGMEGLVVDVKPTVCLLCARQCLCIYIRRVVFIRMRHLEQQWSRQ